MKKLTKVLTTSLAAIVFGSCGPNLSTPKDTVKYCISAFESNNFSKIDKCLSQKSDYRESKDRFDNARTLIVNCKKYADKGTVYDSIDPWADVIYEINVPGCHVGFELKQLPNKTYKLHCVYMPGRNV